MVNINKWDSSVEDNYSKIKEQNEKRQEMLDIMKEVADGSEKSESKERLDTLTEGFLNGNLSTDSFKDAYADYYNEYEVDDDDADDDLMYL